MCCVSFYRRISALYTVHAVKHIAHICSVRMLSAADGQPAQSYIYIYIYMYVYIELIARHNIDTLGVIARARAKVLQ